MASMLYIPHHHKGSPYSLPLSILSRFFFEKPVFHPNSGTHWRGSFSMDAQVLVALALSLVGGLSTSIGTFLVGSWFRRLLMSSFSSFALNLWERLSVSDPLQWNVNTGSRIVYKIRICPIVSFLFLM